MDLSLWFSDSTFISIQFRLTRSLSPYKYYFNMYFKHRLSALPSYSLVAALSKAKIILLFEHAWPSIGTLGTYFPFQIDDHNHINHGRPRPNAAAPLSTASSPPHLERFPLTQHTAASRDLL
jgi:hypothetical protein